MILPDESDGMSPAIIGCSPFPLGAGSEPISTARSSNAGARAFPTPHHLPNLKIIVFGTILQVFYLNCHIILSKDQVWCLPAHIGLR